MRDSSRRSPLWLTVVTLCGALAAGPVRAQAPGEALVKAAAKGDLATVTSLLEQGTDVNAPDKSGNTALMEAARTGKNDVVQALIKAKANLNAQNKDGWTPPMRAIFAAQAATLQTLAGAGADMTLKNNKGQTVVDIALQYTGNVRPEILPILAKAGADVKGAMVKNDPALIYAVTSLQDGLVAGLLKAGADPDVKDGKGRPAVVLAAGKSSLEQGVRMTAAFIAAGANLNARDDRGKSALEYAVDVSKMDYEKAAARKHAGTVVYALVSRGADDASISAARALIIKNRYVLFDTMIYEGKKKALALSQPASPAPARATRASGGPAASASPAGPPPTGCPAGTKLTKLTSSSADFAASQPLDLATAKTAKALLEKNGTVAMVFLTNRGFTAQAMNSDMVVPVKAKGEFIVKLKFMNGTSPVAAGTYKPSAGWGKPNSVLAEAVVTGSKPAGAVITLAAAQSADTGQATITAFEGGYICGNFDVKGGLGEAAGQFVARIEQ